MSVPPLPSYLKSVSIVKAPGVGRESGAAQTAAVAETVNKILADIDARGTVAVREYARRFDDWDHDFLLAEEKKQRLIAQVPEQTKHDIQFAYQQVKKFAEAQRNSLTGFELETAPGVKLGQQIVPVGSVGCYVPGGRYAHAASAIMSVTTAKVAGVAHVIACSPPRNQRAEPGISPAVAYAMDLAGADVILEMGGVHAIAAMARGLFTGQPVDMIVGPGNDYVAEAKNQLFGDIGIDVHAGPTESAIIADEQADPMTIAVDLCSQAEHGPNSPVWLFTTSKQVANKVAELVPRVAADMPNVEVVLNAWRDYGEILLGNSPEVVAQVSDHYACEHLQVMAVELEWWKKRLRNYGSLFLGEGSTVTHGDKCAGTNHILPTGRAARYSGGLNVQKFLKILTYQQIDEQANKLYSSVGSRISRAEGMEGHARACDWRLNKYHSGESWDFEVYQQQSYD